MKIWEVYVEYTEEIFKFEQEFGLEEEVILGMVDLQGCNEIKEEQDEYSLANIRFLFWKQEDGEEIYEEPATLVRKADFRLLQLLKKCAPKTAIVRCRVRRHQVEENRFLLVGNPQKIEDEQLGEKKEEFLKPEEYVVEGIGAMILDTSEEWFEIKTNWNQQNIELVIENSEEKILNMEAQILRYLFANLEEWVQKACDLAADVFLGIKNRDYLEVDEGEAPVDRENFLSRLELECVQVFCDGDFGFWFSDGNLFFGHQILVSGDLKDGVQEAELL